MKNKILIFLIVSMIPMMVWGQGNVAVQKKPVIGATKSKTQSKKASTKTSNAKDEELIICSGEYCDMPFVDLGLPSGTKWSMLNIGADDIYDPGIQFTWGNLYSVFEGERGEKSPLNNVAINDIQGNYDYDVARDRWGWNWMIPNKKDFEELLDNCTWHLLTQDNKPIETDRGYCIIGIGPNGNAIIFPYITVESTGDSMVFGTELWTSQPYSGAKNAAYLVNFLDKQLITKGNRNDALFIRPIFR